MVPIVDDVGHPVGMITDRDICIAAYTQNQLLHQIPVSTIAMKPVVSVRMDDPAQVAERLMEEHQVRRVAVVDGEGRLVGVLSLNDLARAAGRYPRDLSNDEIVKTLMAISTPQKRRERAAAAS